jgi:malate/lactate dehydrogenase
MRLFSLKPSAIDEISYEIINKISIFGGTGNAGFALINKLSQIDLGIKIYLYARNFLSYLKLKTYLDDLDASDKILITLNKGDILDSQVVICCAGISTKNISGINKKDKIFEENYKIISQVLHGFSHSTKVIVVTNPTTKIIKHLRQEGRIFTVGMGVENDNIRFHRTNLNNNTYLVGAHNLSELTVGFSSEEAVKKRYNFQLGDKFYAEVSTFQDKNLSEFQYERIIENLNKLPSELYWYSSQRLNSILNSTHYSCANAVINIIKFMLKSQNTVVIEQPFYFGEFDISSSIGWPINGESKSPLRLWFCKQEIAQLIKVIKAYKIL